MTRATFKTVAFMAVLQGDPAAGAMRAAWYTGGMMKVLEQAIEKVKGLSAERQEYAAEVLEQIAEAGDGVYRLSDDERRLIREGLADLDADRVVPEADMAAFWRRRGA